MPEEETIFSNTHLHLGVVWADTLRLPHLKVQVSTSMGNAMGVGVLLVFSQCRHREEVTLIVKHQQCLTSTTVPVDMYEESLGEISLTNRDNGELWSCVQLCTEGCLTRQQTSAGCRQSESVLTQSSYLPVLLRCAR